MIIVGELLKYAGMVSIDDNDFEALENKNWSKEDLSYLLAEIEQFVKSGFTVQCPMGLTQVERAYYFHHATKYRFEVYRDNALVHREVMSLSPEVTFDDVMKQEDLAPKISKEQQLLEKFAMEAIKKKR